MTPTSAPSIFKPSPARMDTPANLASQPLRFSPQGCCQNRDVMDAIFDALANKTSSDQLVAVILQNAYLNNYVAELNQLIKNIEARHGTGTVNFTTSVLGNLSDTQIALTQNDDGTINLGRQIAYCPDSVRHDSVNSILKETFSEDVCGLINSYDREIEFSEKNKDEIIAILGSDDPMEKSAIIAQASHQNQIRYLNAIFNELADAHRTPNLSDVDLRDLNLTGINLNNIDMSYANLHNTCLVKAQLNGTILIHANLNSANLSRARLQLTDLTSARLIGVNLTKAYLTGTILTDACLVCVNLREIEIGLIPLTLTRATLYFCTVENVQLSINRTKFDIQHVESPIIVRIVSELPNQIPARTFSPGSGADPVTQIQGTKTLVISEPEKNLLQARGMVLKQHPNGMAQLRRSVLICRDPRRHEVIDSTLARILHTALTKLISSYEDDIELCESNETAIMAILKSSDRMAKGRIITAASQQSQINYLNTILDTLRDNRFRLDLSGVDLSYLHLPHINLDGANLTRAIMHGCNLSQASFQHAILIDANLNGAILTKTNLACADMTNARLIQADLTRANLSLAILRRAMLKFAKLESTNMNQSDLTGAFLDYTTLKLTELFHAVLINTSLTHAKIDASVFCNANLTYAKLMHAELLYASLSWANLCGADLSGAYIEGVTMLHTKLSGTVWNGVKARQIQTDSSTKQLLPFRIRFHCDYLGQ